MPIIRQNINFDKNQKFNFWEGPKTRKKWVQILKCATVTILCTPNYRPMTCLNVKYIRPDITAVNWWNTKWVDKAVCRLCTWIGLLISQVCAQPSCHRTRVMWCVYPTKDGSFLRRPISTLDVRSRMEPKRPIKIVVNQAEWSISLPAARLMLRNLQSIEHQLTCPRSWIAYTSAMMTLTIKFFWDKNLMTRQRESPTFMMRSGLFLVITLTLVTGVSISEQL